MAWRVPENRKEHESVMILIGLEIFLKIQGYWFLLLTVRK